MIKVKYSLLAALLITFSTTAQNTLLLNEGAVSPTADLSHVAWMEGHWRGEAFGGITEEIWSPPLGGSMMFSFKLVSDGTVQFYELGHVQEADGTLVLQLKHFHGNLKGWEEKDETVDFKLVKLEDNRVYFEGFTLEKINDDEINIYVVIEEKEKSQEVKFNYKKQ